MHTAARLTLLPPALTVVRADSFSPARPPPNINTLPVPHHPASAILGVTFNVKAVKFNVRRGAKMAIFKGNFLDGGKGVKGPYCAKRFFEEKSK